MALSEYQRYAMDVASKIGLSPDLALRVMQQESGGDQGAISPKGAQGLMQLMPATARELGVDPKDPYQNIEGGLRYLKQQLDRFGREDLALAAYNAGPGAVIKHGGVPPYKETQDYVRKISRGSPLTSKILSALGPSEAQAGELPSAKPVMSPAAPKNDIISEAQKRGLIDANAAALLNEAKKRGLLQQGGGLAQQIPIDNSMDTETGAPYDVRLRVGNAQTPEDRLSTLQKTFPDAQPYEQDNFVYTDPKSKRPKLYNPKGFDIGDIPENTRLAAGVLGGAAGSLAGAAGGAVTGPGAVVASPAGAVVGGGAGTALALSLYDSLANVFGGTDDTRGLEQKLVGYATDGSSSMSGELVTGKVLNALPNTIKGIRNKLAGIGSKELSDTFSRMGISKKGAAGAITGNRSIQGFQSTLHDMPTSANIMDEAMTETIGGVKAYADDLARKYTGGATPGTAQDVGAAIQTGAKSALDRFKVRSGELYDNLYNHIDKESVVPVSNTIDYLKKSLSEWDQAPELGKRFTRGLIDIMKRVEADAPNGGLPFKVLQRLRSEVGDLLSAKMSPGVDDIPTGQLKSLYGAIMSDIEGAVSANGPDAKKAFDTASRYYRFNIGRNVDMIEKIENAGIPEKVFNLATQNQAKGGTTLYKIRRNLKPDEWGFVSGSTLDRMGKALPGSQNVEGSVWSPDTFMRNWGNLSDEAKRELFGIPRYRALRKGLDDLLRVAASLKDSEKMINRSKTGAFGEYSKVITSPAVLLGTLLGSMTGSGAEGKLAGATGGFIASTIGPYAAARLMTNPKFVEWLARGAKIKSPSAIQTHLGRLAGLVASDQSLKPAVDAYLENIQQTLEAGAQHGE